MAPVVSLKHILPLAAWALRATASYYDPVEVDYNLNTNQNAQHPLEYSITWPNHTYHPSPENWRMPFYSFFLDRFVNGDPTNDNANGTSWEHDILGTQLRHGGDMKGLVDTLDYLYGLGIRSLYIAGSMMINLPWESDSYSPIDHTILDHHFGTLQEVRDAIQAIHDHGMYVVMDNTMSTMSDLFAFTAFQNSSTPWSFTEHDMMYKSELRYRDFSQSNTWQEQCPEPYPRFWDEVGDPIHDDNTAQMIGCMDSEFDQYGEAGAFGKYPEWLKQLSKFNAVQDRLREWKPAVLDKINHFSCMVIQGLDIDGFRMDKGMQITVDAQGNFSNYMRECAMQVGKTNFFIPGEIVTGNAEGAIYIGRGKEQKMKVTNRTEAVSTNNTQTIRPWGHSAFDAGAFHYSTYRSFVRFLGLDGNLTAPGDVPVNFADGWAAMVETNDLNNAYTGKFDPRHMYGVSNQDVFRWPGLTNGTERQLLGDFIVTMVMPGIPMISWGEEQTFYTLDNTAKNYLYGRQPMSSAQAWQMHGCYKVGDDNLNEVPFNRSLTACQDDSVSLDHRDPSFPAYTLRKQMFELRRRYPVLNDGWSLLQLSNHTFNWTQVASNNTPTETGLYSVVRSAWQGVQNLDGQGTYGNQPVWLLYSNQNVSRTFLGDCKTTDNAIVAPFNPGTKVRNLIYPFDQYTLEDSPVKYGFQNSTNHNGCLPQLNMTMYGFKAFVPVENWTLPSPSITGFSPGHDARVLSNTSATEPSLVEIELRFSSEMDCDSVTNGLTIDSATEHNVQATIKKDSISCLTIDPIYEAYYYGPSPSIWRYRAVLENAYDGIHRINVKNATNQAKDMFTDAHDHFMLRVGQADNVMVFPKTANYSSSLLFEQPTSKRDLSIDNATHYISHKAAGADKWRFSMSFGAVWSDWYDYKPGNASLPAQTWVGTKVQEWSGEHVQVQYWSALSGSSSHMQEGDLYGSTGPARRFPHFFIHGSFNEYGYDSGIPNEMAQLDNGTWEFDFMTEWPSQFQLNVWGMAANSLTDVSYAFGDVDNDTVLDRINPTSLQPAVVNVTDLGPPSPFLSWRILFNDGDMRYYLVPVGNRWAQLALSILLGVVPLATACLCSWLYVRAFYGVKFNQIGLSEKRAILPFAIFQRGLKSKKEDELNEKSDDMLTPIEPLSPTMLDRSPHESVGAAVVQKRRTVLIATMEYDISDWNIKIKIGGLGVMAQLMSKNLQHQDLIWVVPCVGGIDYPMDTPGMPITVMILGKAYDVQVQYHKSDNITYMLLDAPVFRRQSQKEPYPARMDDLDSAIYYSAWNQCIAEAMRRFPIDLYHINDYHGTVAPLYLLPSTIPCCLSLHNAEFQGLWPMRSPQESEEICSVFNLPSSVVQQYVQFGEVFNLLHAGASILRIHQKGFGAVGVSKKYGKRSWARYPIFWGLRRIGALPNPDPSDVAVWNKKLVDVNEVVIDRDFEDGRAELRRQAQEWAGLEQKVNADLFVFVGRWSMQKGIDLVADVFPAILEKHSSAQLICIGPVIDLHGKFAALKLEKMMEKYPGRVYSKPEFTALPPFLFSGAEFALIPSRDEPFGLVAVEFGRKGALGVGSRVGGLGQMPGWWYTIESTTTKHQVEQFKMAISGALKADYDTRATMRARSAKQRFPVAQWKEDLEILQASSIKIHRERMTRLQNKRLGIESGSSTPSGWTTPNLLGWITPRSGWNTPNGYATPGGPASPVVSQPTTRPSSPSRQSPTSNTPEQSRTASLSLGVRVGPGHVPSETELHHHASKLHKPASAHSNHSESSKSNTSSGIEATISPEQAEDSRRQARLAAITQEHFNELRDGTGHVSTPIVTPGMGTPNYSWAGLPRGQSPVRSDGNTPGPLCSAKVIHEKDGNAQDLTPFFTDPTGMYYRNFDKMLGELNGKTSESQLCIEEYIVKSEKQWFHRLYQARMAQMKGGAEVSEITSPSGSSYAGSINEEPMSQFLLPENYKAPTGLRRLLSHKIGDWPIYSFLLALGQILAANSYTVTLLTGQQGQTAERLYAIASIYLAASIFWWVIFRRFTCVYTMSLPWFAYGLAFFLMAFAPYAPTVEGRGWVQNVATAMYAVASASGSLFFSQNFGSEGVAPTQSWTFRACAIQGTQQLYLVGLWFWGDTLTRASAQGLTAQSQLTYGWPMTAIGVPVAVFLWSIGIVLFLGLPQYYRQKPGAVPSFYSSIFRRKIILWFFFAVFVQNFFLAAPYGRNWAYLWSSNHAPSWTIALLVILFFVLVWATMLTIFGRLSKVHSWIMPMFAVALGAPRWAQIWWSTSNIGTFLPWAGTPLASALLGRSLWLWLGVLDSLQGVGIGMLLLQTLTRLHISYALILAQIVGSVGTIISRADGLGSIGPATYFPSPAADVWDVLNSGGFWICMLFQIFLCIGYFAFFRKEQLAKP
ncbi:hypothetical protein AMS68_004804 [Peltaster fructicola]|uniref:alpha-1,3-glucan synthase n=1 Tax=Peltaster fructicola TaxID=286661 RepID=A0A6H0XWZ0_9PEZI|nr:hypothetical protein AMS68_004804 [Peltaster fructicola]